MKPLSTPQSSSNTFTIGAKQFVVQLAFETIVSSPVNVSSLTPRTTVMSGSFAGAVIITFFAPASICCDAPSLVLKIPVDSTTTLKVFYGMREN